MIKKFKDWLFKRVKESQSAEPSIKDAVAFCTIVLTKEDALIVSCDCKDGHDEAMSKMIFLLSSGALMETMNNLVYQKYADDVKTRDRVVEDAYRMMMQNLDGDDDDELEDDDPVVDPCNVFRQAKGGIEDHDID